VIINPQFIPTDEFQRPASLRDYLPNTIKLVSTAPDVAGILEREL